MGSTTDLDLFKAVDAWIAADPDLETRAQAKLLLDAAQTNNSDALTTLRDAFSGRLEFGTAGLRAELGAGPRRMNRVVVSQTSAGFAAFLLARAARGETTSPPTIVIGYDARKNSDVFARDTAEIMSGYGIKAVLLPEPLPTPVTAFAVRHLNVSAGVMVTASHNPPRDNGYKVYLGDADAGSQIAPPTDATIAAHIAEVSLLPVGGLPRSTNFHIAGPEIEAAYVANTARGLERSRQVAPALLAQIRASSQPLSVVYTAMHGVGSDTFHTLLHVLGAPAPIVVPEQDRPDAEFPTVSFPNPEEPGALDLAMRTAHEHHADLIIAHDPDADRLAIAAAHPDSPQGYRMLSGNELGLLLGWRAAEHHTRLLQTSAAETAARGALANTIVSSPALGKVAAAYELNHVETLSGFKWVSRVPNLVFGFEEALGYLNSPSVVHDKDGISAAADALQMVTELHATGQTVWDLLDAASMRFGHFASSQVVVRLDSPQAVVSLAEKVRTTPPSEFAGVQIVAVKDLLIPGQACLPANVLAYDLADGSRVMIRPSGTEPKLKAYIDAYCDEGSIGERRRTAESALQTIELSLREYLTALASS